MILSLMRQLNPNVTLKRVTLRSNFEVYSNVTFKRVTLRSNFEVYAIVTFGAF